MRSPVLKGLFISFFILAGVGLMGQAAPPILQAFGPEVPPAHVRVIDAQTTGPLTDQVNLDDDIAILPDDVTLLDEQNDAATDVATSDEAEVVEPAATQGPSDVQTPVAPATAIARVPPTPVPAVPTAMTLVETPAPDNADTPLFSWESEDGSHVPEAEIVDVQPAHLRPLAPGNPTRIVIPSIHVDSPVVNVNLVTSVQRGKTVSMWQVARNAVGFHHSSAVPGTQGNAVMSAHNNAWGRVFRDLIHVKLGEVIEVYAGDRLLHYKVEDIVLVRQDQTSAWQRFANAAWIGPTTDERLTLVSCWPYRRATHRVIIIARPA